jgi:hypothetical protein
LLTAITASCVAFSRPVPAGTFGFLKIPASSALHKASARRAADSEERF